LLCTRQRAEVNALLVILPAHRSAAACVRQSIQIDRRLGCGRG
jgi:hypothetical protein